MPLATLFLLCLALFLLRVLPLPPISSPSAPTSPPLIPPFLFLLLPLTHIGSILESACVLSGAVDTTALEYLTPHWFRAFSYPCPGKFQTCRFPFIYL